MKPREFKWKGFYPKYSRYVNLSEFLSAYTTIEAICNAINSLELMSGPAATLNSSFSGGDGALVIESPHLISANGGKIMSNSMLDIPKAALIFEHENLTISRGALILNEAAFTVKRGGLILDHANLSASRLLFLFLHANLTAAKRVKYAHFWDKLGSKLPAATGDWTIVPSNLSNITDDASTTTCGTGSVFAGPGEVKTGYITIDIGAIVSIKVITLKYSGGASGTGTGSLNVEHSEDGVVWTTLTSSFSEDTTFLIDDSVRYLRFVLFASAGVGQTKTCYLTSCHFALG